MGTRREICVLVRDPFNDLGVTIATLFTEFCRKHRIQIPWKRGRWMSWKHAGSSFIEFTSLDDMTNRISRVLRKMLPDTRHVSNHRGLCSKDMNIYTVGGNTGPHQDAQSYGRFVFVFCTGLACHTSVWLGGKPVPEKDRNASKEWLNKQGFIEKQIKMRSGDCLIFEGKTWHQVRECIPGTSPPVLKGGLFEDRRLSILVRQNSR